MHYISTISHRYMEDLLRGGPLFVFEMLVNCMTRLVAFHEFLKDSGACFSDIFIIVQFSAFLEYTLPLKVQNIHFVT